MARRFGLSSPPEVTGQIFKTTQVTVTNTATALPTDNLDDRKAVSVRNWSNSITVFVGGADVTTANGYPLQAYESLPFNMSQGADLYGITASGTADCRVIEVDNR